MSYKDDCKGTSESEFRVGMAGGGQRIFSVFNGFLARMRWTPTATRDITIPDSDGTLAILKNNGLELKSFAYASLPTTGLPSIAIAFTPDHPTAGATVVSWNGTTWAAVGGGTTDVLAAYRGGTYSLIMPNSTTTFTVIGTSQLTAGTISTPNLSIVNYLNTTRRSVLTGAAAAGTVVSMRHANPMVYRGNAAGRGGFRLVWRFGLETLAAGQRASFCLQDAGGAPTNIDPLTSTIPGRVGLAINTNTGNWQLINNSVGTAPTVLDLGVNFPVNNTDIIEMDLRSLPNASGISYIITNKATGSSTSGTLTANIPANNLFLMPVGWMTNNVTAAAFALCSVYQELTSPN